jgi:nucleoside 2-deoxyribosyltransferase
MKIYLAGPMDNCSMEYQRDWRDRATEYLKGYDVETLDPCRRPHQADLTPKEIYDLDLKDVRDSELILVDVRRIERPSWGTAMEIMYAHEVCRIPCVGWHDGEGALGTRIFLEATLSRTFNSLDNALDQISAFYLK